jgi:hypothetical protein
MSCFVKNTVEHYNIKTPNWDPDLGPRFWTPILDPDFGPQFWTLMLDPNFGPQFETPIWDPDFLFHDDNIPHSYTK